MIWKHWPVGKLQQEIGDSILEKIGQILPLIDKDGNSIFFETDRKSLVLLMGAFANEKYFSKATNIENCLNFLPPEKLKMVCDSLDISPPWSTSEELAKVSKLIAKNAGRRKIFLDFFHIPQRFYPKISEVSPPIFICHPPSFSSPIEISSAYKVLKDYQYDIFFRTVARLSPDMSRMILQMPTGSGKTRTAMEVISSHFNSDQTAKSRVVWLANSEELCEQAVACFIDVWKHVGKNEVEVQRVWGGNPKPEELMYSTARQFIVGSLQSFWKLVSENDKDFNVVFRETSLLVIDEAHIAVAETYSKVVKEIARLSHCRVIGLTATPGRTIEEETTTLSELFHGEIVSLHDPKQQWDNTIAYLRSIQVLSKVTYDPLVVDSGITLSLKELNKLENELDFSSVLLKKIGRSTVRSAEIAARLKPLLNGGSKILLFAPSIENSKFLTSLFTFLGFAAAHIDGDTHSVSRAQIIDDYKNGGLQIICNYGVLATGFDAPKTDVLCIARPTKSPVLYSQMIGRGLRGPAVGGTADCRIIEVQDNFFGQGTQDELYEHFSEYWNA